MHVRSLKTVVEVLKVLYQNFFHQLRIGRHYDSFFVQNIIFYVEKKWPWFNLKPLYSIFDLVPTYERIYKIYGIWARRSLLIEKFELNKILYTYRHIFENFRLHNL